MTINKPKYQSVSVRPKVPTLSRVPSEPTIMSTISVTLTCTSQSSGTKSYKFLKDGNIVFASTGDANGIHDNVYTISGVSASNSGSYSCIVTISAVDSIVSNSNFITVVGMSLLYSYLYRN